MIEQAMLFTLGFLAAALLALAIAPAFWHRAIRLSRRRLEMQLPVSAREVLAERDLLRAEFAVERRKLEQKCEALDAVHARDLAELGRRVTELVAKEADLVTLRRRLGEVSDTCASLEHDLVECRGELGATLIALHDATALSARKDAELGEAERHLVALQTLAKNQRTALTVLERDLVEAAENRAVDAARLARLSDELSALELERNADHARLTAQEARIADHEHSLAAAREREADWQKERAALEKAARAETDKLRREIERLRAENTALREMLEEKRRAFEAFRPEVDKPHGKAYEQAPGPPGSEDDEMAILREHISEIGAAVLRLAEASKLPPAGDASKAAEPVEAADPIPSCLVLTKPGRGKTKS